MQLTDPVPALVLNAGTVSKSCIIDLLAEDAGRLKLPASEEMEFPFSNERGYYTVSLAASVIERSEFHSFDGLGRLRKLCAVAVLQSCSLLSTEKSGAIFALAVRALDVMTLRECDAVAVLIRFLYYLLKAEGHSFSFDRCDACGHNFISHSLVFFNPYECRTECALCRTGDSCEIKYDTRELFRNIAASEFKALFLPRDKPRSERYLLYLLNECISYRAGEIPAVYELLYRTKISEIRVKTVDKNTGM